MPLLQWKKHKQIMVHILNDIYKDSFLGNALGFKGGTAAMLFYELSRRSVDLDFDLLRDVSEDEVLQNISKIVEKYGTLKECRIKRYTIFCLLSYGDHDANIKIEISRRGAQGEYEIQNYLGISLLVMCKKDMFANKLVALMNRSQTASRDIYDVWFFMQNMWNVNEAIVEEKMDMSFEKYCITAAEFIEDYSSQKILAGLGELIDQNEKIWVKESLINETALGLRLLAEKEMRVCHKIGKSE